MSDGLFIVQGDLNAPETTVLLEMREQHYDSEDVLQALIARYPDLLAGAQVNPDAPRRWLLVKREQGIADTPGGPDRWSIDHLLVDQDAIPTFVEVKRKTDTRLRREVVGQMLDYAANAVAHSTAAALRAEFEKTTADPEQELRLKLDVADSEAFWALFEQNLRQGNVRLLFVADEIPRELRRIVEFLNGQMRADVLAIEVKQHMAEGHGGLRTLITRVYGRTEQAADAKKRPQGRTWDEKLFMEALGSQPPGIQPVARRLLEWAGARNINILWGTGAQTGSCNLWRGRTVSGSRAYILTVRTDGKAEIGFGYLAKSLPFESLASRVELLNRINAVPGLTTVSAGKTELYPTIALAELSSDVAFSAFIAALDWAVSRFD